LEAAEVVAQSPYLHHELRAALMKVTTRQQRVVWAALSASMADLQLAAPCPDI